MKILIAGDYAPIGRLTKEIEERNFSDIFPEEIRHIIKTSDFSFVNLECPVADSSFKPIPKAGPNLSCKDAALDAIKYAGFSGVTMANNHILDYGYDGLLKTLDCLKLRGMAYLGAGNNLDEARKPLLLENNGKTLAVINCCEHEFSIASESAAGANPLNPINQFYAIKEAKEKADSILVIVHGGHEHFQLPSLRMKETYRFFIDAGADAVVNHHQHCYSGYEMYKGKPIFYGIGNFCFDCPSYLDEPWNNGFMVVLNFMDNAVDIDNIIPYSQCGKTLGVRLLSNKEQFEKQLFNLNQIIANSTLLVTAAKDFYKATNEQILLGYYPNRYRLFNLLRRFHLLPKCFNRQRYLQFLNFMECESHLDKQIYVLKEYLNILR